MEEDRKPVSVPVLGARIELGLLFSRSGSYSLISEACRSGALAAIARINADPALPLASR